MLLDPKPRNMLTAYRLWEPSLAPTHRVCSIIITVCSGAKSGGAIYAAHRGAALEGALKRWGKYKFE